MLSLSRFLSIKLETTKVVQLASRFLSDTPKSNYEVIEPIYPISQPKRHFPDKISLPNYATNGGFPVKHANQGYVKSSEDILKITKSCKIAKTILMTVGQRIQPGLTCEHIDDMVYELCLHHQCYPSPLQYSHFPKCVTTSVNNIVVHAIPDGRRLQNGDIISVDVSIYYDGFHGDCCYTFPVGSIDANAKHLINVAELSLYKAIEVCRIGGKISTIGKTIESFARQFNMGVVREFCGHGVGTDLHENPQILHYDHDSNELIQENMVFTIEPIITETSDASIVMYDDHWTVATENNSRAAQFEHTIWMSKSGPVILTHVD